LTARPYATWELILMAVVVIGWEAIVIRVLVALWRQRQRDRDPINRWRPPPPWRNDQ
jgi:hypothetical protein